jgi:hypothetical protein
MLEFERENTRSHSLENSLWKGLWTCRKTDYAMNEMLLFKEAEENHENKVDGKSHRG